MFLANFVRSIAAGYCYYVYIQDVSESAYRTRIISQNFKKYVNNRLL